MQNPAEDVLTSRDKLTIEQAVAACGERPGALLGILEMVQQANPHRYLSAQSLSYIAETTGVPPARVYSTATFFSLFSLAPQGDNVLRVPRHRVPYTQFTCLA